MSAPSKPNPVPRWKSRFTVPYKEGTKKHRQWLTQMEHRATMAYGFELDKVAKLAYPFNRDYEGMWAGSMDERGWTNFPSGEHIERVYLYDDNSKPFLSTSDVEAYWAKYNEVVRGYTIVR